MSCWPAGQVLVTQGVHWEAPEAEKVPTAQASHASALTPKFAVPAAHAAQLLSVLFSPSVNPWPVGQENTVLAVHCVVVPPLEYSLVPQGVQVESLEEEPAV